MPRGKAGSSSRPTRTLLRGLAVLETLASERRSLGPTEIAGIVDLDKATVSRLLTTLQEAGYVRRDPATRTYTLSMKILQLSQAFSPQLGLREISHPHLRKLCDEVHETVHLGIRDGARVVYVDKVESEGQSIRMVSAVGQTMPVHTTALGKAILAALRPEDRDRALEGVTFDPRSPRSITNREAFLEELERTRARGYAIDDRENEDNVTCVGAPIVGTRGDVIAAISISAPTFRVSDKVAALGAACRATAEGISQEIGLLPIRS